MRGKMLRTIVCLTGFALLSTPLAAVSAKDKSKPKDPDEKVCEDITMVGSRLAVKRICATRSEWAERRRDERMTIDNAQVRANDPCNTINTHSGGAAC